MVDETKFQDYISFLKSEILKKIVPRKKQLEAAAAAATAEAAAAAAAATAAAHKVYLVTFNLIFHMLICFL